MKEIILREQIDRVLLVTLNRPNKRNALNVPLWLELQAVMKEAQNNNTIAAVVLTGSGGNFCAGTDTHDPIASDLKKSPYEACAKTIAAFDKPMLAAVNGTATSVGAALTFHCDVVYVGESLRMRLAYTSMGLVPEFAASYMLKNNIGAQRAAELILSSEWIDADKAVEYGLAANKFSDEELLEKTLIKAAQIAQWPINALRETKHCLKISQKTAIDTAFAREMAGTRKQAGSPENEEAKAALMERRKPNFRNL
ncbi:MAG: enoyl-CoA hydratase/carnithine racemase [Pseudomonadales bacterium]|jgi:enoyl-CoA hydratase/carnithine racemase